MMAALLKVLTAASVTSYRESSWEESRMAKRSLCRKAALSSKPSFASAATNVPSSVSARGFTCQSESTVTALPGTLADPTWRHTHAGAAKGAYEP